MAYPMQPNARASRFNAMMISCYRIRFMLFANSILYFSASLFLLSYFGTSCLFWYTLFNWKENTSLWYLWLQNLLYILPYPPRILWNLLSQVFIAESYFFSELASKVSGVTFIMCSSFYTSQQLWETWNLKISYSDPFSCIQLRLPLYTLCI